MFNVLINPKKAESHPFEIAIMAFIYSSISILLASMIFPDYASLIIIFFTSFSCLYVVQGAIKIEESKEIDYTPERNLLKEHSKIINLMISLFVGFVLSFTFWTLMLPSEKVSILFEMQQNIVEGIRSMSVTGNAVSNTDALGIILINNFKVLAISFIISLFYGAGAIFVLAWNASVMGFVIGSIAKSAGNIFLLPVLFTKYFIHGIPEMFSYIVVILSGSILFVSFWRKDIFVQGRRKSILIDTGMLIVIAMALVIVSAFIEVFISSLI